MEGRLRSVQALNSSSCVYRQEEHCRKGSLLIPAWFLCLSCDTTLLPRKEKEHGFGGGVRSSDCGVLRGGGGKWRTHCRPFVPRRHPECVGNVSEMCRKCVETVRAFKPRPDHSQGKPSQSRTHPWRARVPRDQPKRVSDTFPTHFRHISDTFREPRRTAPDPSRHISDTFPTHFRHIWVTNRDPKRTHPAIPCCLRILYAQTSEGQRAPNTQKQRALAKRYPEKSFRHILDTFSTHSRPLINLSQT